MSSQSEFEVPKWDQIYSMLLDLADKIKGSGFRPDVIIGVSRGGWPPARVLSDLLEIPDLVNVRAEFYVGVAETKGEPTITQPLSGPIAGKKVLVVDEVADTGKSLKLVKEHVTEHKASEVKVATVYYKPWSVIKPDYYDKETSLWIVFPWEMKETIGKIVKKCREKGKDTETEIAKLIQAGVPAGLVKRFLKEIQEEDAC